MSAHFTLLDVSEIYEASLIEAARDTKPVNGLTHTFYRYPARFSPRFVRASIQAFTQPGDLVIDPFMGGGTTLVEAMALGRRAVGTDISALATFITEVKTTLFTDGEIATMAGWIARAQGAINIHRPSPMDRNWSQGQDYKKHLYHRSTWRLRKAIEQSLECASRLSSPKLERFARCVVLRTAQWALDSRKRLPSISEFRTRLVEYFEEMAIGIKELQAETAASQTRMGTVLCLNRSAVGLEQDPAFAGLPAPRLVLTSPPYPGVHVLYHRWQVDGRKETPAPFWIARMLDGSGASYYTMGDRKEQQLKTYYDTLIEAFRSIARLCDDRTVIIQMVAFAFPDWQLSRYLDVMQDAGFQECHFAACVDSPGGRLWRAVPNRRWHADQKGETPGSREVVLIHKLARPSVRHLARVQADGPKFSAIVH